ncbi:MAG: DUF4340 domain-containing protein [Clostridia bacterium]
MKPYKSVIIVVLVLAILTTAYILIKDKKGTNNNNNSTTDTGQITKLTDLNIDSISEFTIKNTYGTFNFVESDEKWVISDKKEIALNQSIIVNNIIGQMAAISSTAIVTDNAGDVATYGFGPKNNQMTLKIKLSDGSVKELEIGKRNFSKESNYARYPGSTKIFLVDSFVYDTFEFSLEAIRDTLIFNIDIGDIAAYSLTKKGVLVYNISKLESGGWVIDRPVVANADTKVLSTIFETLTGLSKINIIENNAKNLSKYGLDKPSYKIEITHKTGKIVLILGDMKVSGSEIYAKLGDSNEIFTMDISGLNFIDKPVNEVMDIYVYQVPIGTVSNVRVSMDGHVTNLGIVSDGNNFDKDTFTVNGKDASKSDSDGRQLARLYYQALIDLRRMEAINTTAKPSGKVEVTITYTLEISPYTMKIELISKDSKYFYIMKNGKFSGFTMKKNQLNSTEGVRDIYTKLMKMIK